jgi:long-chain acyl-CoA synthetase
MSQDARLFSSVNPAKVAIQDIGQGRAMTYRELDDQSLLLAGALHAAGLTPEHHIATLMSNRAETIATFWAAQRSGLYYTPVSGRLTVREASFIIRDCGAEALLVSAANESLALELETVTPGVAHRISVDALVDGHTPLPQFIETNTPHAGFSETDGMPMFYSSGTTGRPKGIKRDLLPGPAGSWQPLAAFQSTALEFDESTVYLCPAPLYHAAPLNWSMTVHRAGGTLVLMERFDPLEALRLIERHRVTHAQFVPTMLSRMLQLPREARSRIDVSSLRAVIHAAAPCPPSVKRDVIGWFGPIVYEYYGTSEGIGLTLISSDEWLRRLGSVGRSISGPIHILDATGTEVGASQNGVVYFDGSAYTNRAAYWGAAAAEQMPLYDHRCWATVGDIGRLDADGYLYITERRSDIIISGGVNVYPREIEDVLMNHPSVIDAAAIGVPDADLGERVIAVVELFDGRGGSDELERDLLQHCRAQLAGYKCPTSVVFTPRLPRGETGKMPRNELRSKYSGLQPRSMRQS